MADKADIVFEVSYEVCNKVGGIYRVIESKLNEMSKLYGKNYYAVGPYVPDKAAIWFNEQPVPTSLVPMLSDLKDMGIICHYGKWLVKGKPNCMLIDCSGFAKEKNAIKARLWEEYGIDSLFADMWFDDPAVWSTAVGVMLEKFSKANEGKRVVAHFHEWLCGGALLYVKKRSGIRSVFTTHATVMGRTIAGSGQDLYAEVDEGLRKGWSMPDSRANEFNQQAKHLMEKACAHNADVFTTVSEITGKEAQYILGKKPDIITPNGIEVSEYPGREDLINKHKVYREKMRDFLRGYFGPYYPLNFDNSLIFFTTGRYEFRNKGLDILIDALGKLNHVLREKKSGKTVFFFIFVPAATKGMNVDVLSNLSLFHDMRELVDEEMPYVKRRMLDALAKGEMPTMDELFDVTFMRATKQDYQAFKKKGNSPVNAYELHDPRHDPILAACNKNGLDNDPTDRVKIIFYPVYVSKADGMLGMDYDEVIMGSHMGVFPSYYEPWGYTPVESAIQNCLSITTDLSGFGVFVEENIKGKDYPGIMVLKREGRQYGEMVDDLFGMMHGVCRMGRNKRLEKKSEARQFAETTDWSKLIHNYAKAHEMALGK